MYSTRQVGVTTNKVPAAFRPVSRVRKVKILVTGAFNAGKTEFIQSACDGHIVRSERAVTGQQASIKPSTTVALDFGKVLSQRGNQLLLFGTPGQERFGESRNILARGAAGGVLVVDCTDEASLDEARQMAEWLGRRLIPLVVAANKQDLPRALGGPALRQLLGLGEEIKVLECSAVKRETVLQILAELEGEICNRGAGITRP